MATTTAKSGPAPKSGEKNRSGSNFQFGSTPSSEMLVSMPKSIYCVLEHVNGASNDNVVYILYDAVRVPKDMVKKGANYYLASPQGALADFDVVFTYD